VLKSAQVALENSVTRDQIDDVLADLGCALVNVVPRSDEHPAQIILVTADRCHLVYVIDDARVAPRAIVIHGELAEERADAIRRAFARGAEET
jgi:hypothetical protein